MVSCFSQTLKFVKLIKKNQENLKYTFHLQVSVFSNRLSILIDDHSLKTMDIEFQLKIKSNLLDTLIDSLEDVDISEKKFLCRKSIFKQKTNVQNSK